MSIELKQAAEKALVVLGSATSFMSRKARDQHESVVAELRAAIQQAEAQQVATTEPVLVQHRIPVIGWKGRIIGYTPWRDGKGLDKWPHRALYDHPAPGVPDGWRIEEKGGALIVRKNGFGGYSARKNTESIAEAVLHELALDLLAASPAQKGSS